MRMPLIIGLGAAALALATSAGAAPRPDPNPPASPVRGAKPAAPAARAPSAESRGVAASYQAGPGHGYSPRDRRMLDCLASDPRYDPGSDRILVRPGVTRPCEVDRER